jgi:hypothetical protein
MAVSVVVVVIAAVGVAAFALWPRTSNLSAERVRSVFGDRGITLYIRRSAPPSLGAYGRIDDTLYNVGPGVPTATDTYGLVSVYVGKANRDARGLYAFLSHNQVRKASGERTWITHNLVVTYIRRVDLSTTQKFDPTLAPSDLTATVQAAVYDLGG